MSATKVEADGLAREELITMAKKRASGPSPYGKPPPHLHNATHPALANMDQRFAPHKRWEKMAYPAIEIAGLPKAGTSQLYKILSQRPDIRGFQRSKETCFENAIPKGYETSSKEEQLYVWHENVYNKRTKSGVHASMKTVNGCIKSSDVILRYQYIKPINPRIIVLLRDPADWLWAAWNFWIVPELDENTDFRTNWAVKEHHYRSPELFHEIVAAGSKTTLFRSRFHGFRDISIQRNRELIAAVGRENVLVMKGEDMRPEVVDAPGGFLDRLSNFTGLDRSLYGKEIFSITNCNDHKGTRANCGSKSSSAYEIAGNREMLPQTRELIYLHFLEECKIWAQEFGVEYPNCLNVLQ